MKFTIVRAGKYGEEELPFDYKLPDAGQKQRPMVLDLLLQAATTSMPDLAYRYGCRNRMCGVCTVDVNGIPRIACRTKVREGDRISALSTLPVLRDLVVKRDAIGRQLKGRLSATSGDAGTTPGGLGDSNDQYLSLNRCIECYACLDGCPLHAKNEAAADVYPNGNPFSLLKLQTVMVDPGASHQDRARAMASAMELGLETCLGCKGCSCGVGIDLMKEVIRPLLESADLIRS